MLTDEALALMKERGTWLVPTTTLRDIELPDLPPAILAKRRSIAAVAKESLRRAIKAGVKIALGTDAGVLPHGTNGREVAAMVSRGMTPADALRAGTTRRRRAARSVRPRGDRGRQGGGSDRGGGQPAGGSDGGAAGAVGDEGGRGGVHDRPTADPRVGTKGGAQGGADRSAESIETVRSIRCCERTLAAPPAPRVGRTTPAGPVRQ